MYAVCMIFKMKNMRLSIFIILIALLNVSCDSDSKIIEDGFQTTNGDVELSFEIDLQAEQIQTRAANAMDKIYMLLFDQNGIWLMNKAVQLNKGKAKLYLPENCIGGVAHFVWGQPAALENFDRVYGSQDFTGMDEGDLINQIAPEDELFWARNDLKVKDNKIKLGTVELLRNTAKVTIENKAPTKSKFRIHGFTMHNTPVRGTLAPFDGSKQTFEQGVITKAYPLAYNPLAPMDENNTLQVDESNVHFTAEDQPKELFERHRSSSEHTLYLILKAEFNGKLGYYKIGFYDNTTLRRLDIKRNTHYKIKIMSVSKAGYASLQDAINNEPVENASLSILLEEYAKISNGSNSLEVGGTAFTLHKANERFSVSYNYTSSARSSNVEPEIDLIQTAGEEVFTPSSFRYTHNIDSSKNKHSGTISGITNPLRPENSFYSAEIRVRFGDLVRVIQVDLGPKRELQADITVRGDQADDLVVIRFMISKSDLTGNSILPMDFFIDTHYLYPSTDGYNSNLSIVTDPDNGHYHYRYVAKETGTQFIYFKRTLSNKGEVIKLKSEHFKTKDLVLTGGNSLIKPVVVKGKIFYMLNGVKTPLRKDTRVWVEPSDMPRSFWLPDTGKYEFQFDQRHISAEHTVKVSIDPIERVEYSYETLFSDLLATNSEIVLEPKIKIQTSNNYAYWRNTNNYHFNVSDKTFYVANHPEIKVMQNPDHLNIWYFLRFEFPNNIADDEVLRIYAYNNRNKYYFADVTFKTLRENRGIDFGSYRKAVGKVLKKD